MRAPRNTKMEINCQLNSEMGSSSNAKYFPRVFWLAYYNTTPPPTHSHWNAKQSAEGAQIYM